MYTTSTEVLQVLILSHLLSTAGSVLPHFWHDYAFATSSHVRRKGTQPLLLQLLSLQPCVGSTVCTVRSNLLLSSACPQMVQWHCELQIRSWFGVHPTPSLWGLYLPKLLHFSSCESLYGDSEYTVGIFSPEDIIIPLPHNEKYTFLNVW